MPKFPEPGDVFEIGWNGGGERGEGWEGLFVVFERALTGSEWIFKFISPCPQGWGFNEFSLLPSTVAASLRPVVASEGEEALCQSTPTHSSRDGSPTSGPPTTP